MVVVFVAWRLFVAMLRSRRRLEAPEPTAVRQYIVIKATTEKKPGEAASAKLAASP